MSYGSINLAEAPYQCVPWKNCASQVEDAIGDATEGAENRGTAEIIVPAYYLIERELPPIPDHGITFRGLGGNDPTNVAKCGFQFKGVPGLRTFHQSGENWHHGTRIRDMSLDAEAGNAVGSGLRFYRPGELSEIWNISAHNWPGDAIQVTGGTPGQMGRLSLMRNGNGLKLDTVGSVSVYGLSGDDNGRLLKIDNSQIGGGGIPSVVVHHIKAETKDPAKHNPVVEIHEGKDVALTLAGGRITGIHQGDPTGRAVVRITGSDTFGGAQLHFTGGLGVMDDHYEFLWDDETNSYNPLGEPRQFSIPESQPNASAVLRPKCFGIGYRDQIGWVP